MGCSLGKGCPWGRRTCEGFQLETQGRHTRAHERVPGRHARVETWSKGHSVCFAVGIPILHKDQSMKETGMECSVRRALFARMSPYWRSDVTPHVAVSALSPVLGTGARSVVRRSCIRNHHLLFWYGLVFSPFFPDLMVVSECSTGLAYGCSKRWKR
jgi:hypothetical protein